MSELCNVCMNERYLYPLECPHKFCLECIKGCCMRMGSCPYCRQAFSDDYREKIMLRPETILDLTSTIDEQIRDYFARYTDGVYVYEGRANGCWLFSDHIQQEIKIAEETKTDVFDVLLCGQMVTIDLKRKIQTTQSSNAVRRIWKIGSIIEEPIKGIAGMACNLNI
jgi:hypothetical protein